MLLLPEYVKQCILKAIYKEEDQSRNLVQKSKPKTALTILDFLTL